MNTEGKATHSSQISMETLNAIPWIALGTEPKKIIIPKFTIHVTA